MSTSDDAKRSPLAAARERFRVLLLPENRLPVVLGVGLVSVSVVGAVLFYALSGGDQGQRARLGDSPVDTAAVGASAGAETSPAYREAQEAANAERYERAARTPGGVSLPLTFEDGAGVDGAGDGAPGAPDDIDAQVLAALKRLGVDPSTLERDSRRLGDSDLWLTPGGQMVDERGGPIRFDGELAFRDDRGAIVDSAGAPLLDSRGVPMYILPDGRITGPDDSATQGLLGRLTTDDGVVFLTNGELASRPTNTRRLGDSDLYLSPEGQLLTVDGRPVRSQGLAVFIDDERRLFTRGGTPVQWEGEPVYLTMNGALVNGADKGFEREGILLAATGDPVTNAGRLTAPLKDFEQLGDSDLALTGSGLVVDLAGRPVRHAGLTLRRATNERVILEDGRPLLSRAGAPVSLTDRGAFRTAMGAGVLQSGAVVDGEGVAYTRRGQLVTRPGTLERRGASDIYLTGDGLLTSRLGVAMTHRGLDVFIAEGQTRPDGSDLLVTVDGRYVRAENAPQVYLGVDGELLRDSGEVLAVAGVLRTRGGILLTGDGRLARDPRNLALVTDRQGRRAFLEGRPVFREPGGRLVDSGGTPFYLAGVDALYLDEDGTLADGAGMPLEGLVLLSEAGQPLGAPYRTEPLTRTVQLGESDIFLTRDGALVDRRGRGLFHDGEGVRADPENGQLFTESGEEVKDRLRHKARLTDGGALVDPESRPIASEVLQQVDGTVIGVNGRSVTETMVPLGDSDLHLMPTGLVLDRAGRAVRAGDYAVYRDPQTGRLRDSTGQALADIDGRALYLDRDGAITRQGGARPEAHALVDGAGGLIDSQGRQLSRSGLLRRVTETGVFRTALGQLTNREAVPVTVDGDPLFLGPDNALTSAGGRSRRIAGAQAYLLADGSLVDRDGRPVRGDDDLALLLAGVGLVDENGLALEAGEPILLAADVPAPRPAPGTEPAAQAPTTSPAATRPPPSPATADASEDAPASITLSPEASARLVRRYERLLAGVVAQTQQVQTVSARTVAPATITVGGRRGPETPAPGVDAATGDPGTTEVARTGNSITSYDVLRPAGDALYAILMTAVNSDLSDRVIAKIVGVPPRDPLYDGKLVGRLDVRYDQAVITFDSLLLGDGRSARVDGLALDPTTVEAGLDAEVDRHLLYRYGGLLLGSLIEGAAVAARETVDTTEVVTPGGSRFQQEGLDGTALAVRSLEPVGRRIATSMERSLNRPVTVRLPVGAEIGVVLFEPIRLSERRPEPVSRPAEGSAAAGQ